ncbi:NS1 [Rousettus leschenaultii bocaparvovirus 1]|uniref:Initiator protein NS1 n=1 Tax=Rousettus leschenaultii bocaparvovirus 1 TaxID=2053082 RepID=A0A2H4N9V9_9VIRU|nr:NS1 [Rousettus leschenaultii bocaparvovirus 1]ATV81497.1 NS1 [Rousettus leschenaultii bocaparvovirus 1]
MADSNLVVFARDSDFLSFKEPAYTYVLNFPWKDWSSIEETLQMAFCPSFANIISLEDWANLAIADDYDRVVRILNERGYVQHYGAVLARSLHRGLVKEFQARQGKPVPDLDTYVQVEMGAQNLHAHILVGGLGLTRYNAKALKTNIGIRATEAIITHLKSTLGLHYDSVEFQCVTVPIELLRHQLRSGTSDAVTILQYKARNGEMHACRVNPREYISNYLMPKNLKFNSRVNPAKLTPEPNFFAMTEKTYAFTLMNGKIVSCFDRRTIWEKLRQSTDKSLEPVFGGDPFGALPQVMPANWNALAKPGGRMTKKEGLMLDCLKQCLDNHLLTPEQLMDFNPSLVVMMESQSGGSKLLEQTLNMAHVKLCQSYTTLEYILKRYPVRPISSSNKVFQLCNTQGYNPWQLGHWICTLFARKANKQNTVCFYGPASTGKTNLAKGIAEVVKLYGCVNHQNKNFIFNDCTHKLLVWWEEALMHSDWVEQAKCLLGGTTFRIDRKHRDSCAMGQTPVIISTNNDLYTTVGGNASIQVHSKPLKDRIVQLNFMKSLPSTFGEIPSDDVADWITNCASRFTCTLEGFLSQWGLRHVLNAFPLNTYCDSHSQDFVLEDCGICDTCGGYIPLQTYSDSTGASSPGNLSPLLNDVLDMEAEYVSNFDLSLLATPEKEEKEPATPRKRRRRLQSDPADGEQPSTSKQLRAAPIRRVGFSDPPVTLNYYDEWESMPITDTEWEIYLRQRDPAPIEEPKQESSKGPTPSQWGELLGVTSHSMEEEPTVLHCFETIDYDELEEEKDHTI